jgi:hypothetical protein
MDQQARLQLFGCDMGKCGENVHDKCPSCLKEYCVDHLEHTAHPCKRLSGNSISPSESVSQVTEVTETQLIVAETPRMISFPYESFSIKAIKKDVTGLFYKESDKLQLLPSGKSWKVKCLACDAVVTRNSSTRYNLVQHTIKHHSSILEYLKQKASIPTSAVSFASTKNQRSMREFVKENAIPYSDSAFEEALLKWVVNDDQSFLV